jgi:hypothetical protein
LVSGVSAFARFASFGETRLISTRRAAADSPQNMSKSH